MLVSRRVVEPGDWWVGMDGKGGLMQPEIPGPKTS